MREIVFDTETTGLDPRNGDRVVEIGAIELINHIPSGQVFHQYIDPERSMPAEAFKVHGLSEEFLTGKPKFADIADQFAAFIEDARLIAHNASFDMSFINAEFARLGHDPVADDRVIDTLQIARRRHPGGQNSLDALCNRYGIDNSKRTKHGALLDSELLAEVYIELIGGKQAALGFAVGALEKETVVPIGRPKKIRAERPAPLPDRLGDDERSKHAAFVEELGEKAIWRRYNRS